MMKKCCREKRGKLGKSILVFLFVVLAVTISVDFVRYPETYITPWRYQLQTDVERGKESAIEYYNRVYVANGIELWEK